MELYESIAKMLSESDAAGLWIDGPKLKIWRESAGLRIEDLVAQLRASAEPDETLPISNRSLSRLEETRRRYASGDRRLRVVLMIAKLAAQQDLARGMLEPAFEPALGGDLADQPAVLRLAALGHHEDFLIRSAQFEIIYAGLHLFRGSRGTERVPLFPFEVGTHPDRHVRVRILIVDPFCLAGRALADAFLPESVDGDPRRAALRTIAAFRGGLVRARRAQADLQLRIHSRIIPGRILSIDRGTQTVLKPYGLDGQTVAEGLFHAPALLFDKGQVRRTLFARVDQLWAEAKALEEWESGLDISERLYFSHVESEERGELLFVYGLRMAAARMLRDCPSAVPLGRAALPDRALGFPSGGRWVGQDTGLVGVTRRDNSEVQGVLWQVTPSDLRRLDRELHPRGYRREPVSVLVGGERHGRVDLSAQAYLLLPSQDPPPPPSVRYVKALLAAGVEAGLDPEDLERMVAQAGLSVPVAELLAPDPD